jgi:hypothetical protein
MGLILFVTTVMGTVVLTQLANQRQQRRLRKELWGNLGTEEGVDALLQTTWKFRGDKMEVYNKIGLGYRDDDSILLGGFQQTELLGNVQDVTQTDLYSAPIYS